MPDISLELVSYHECCRGVAHEPESALIDPRYLRSFDNPIKETLKLMSSRCSSNAISFSLCDDEDDAVGLASRCQSLTHARPKRRPRLALRKKRRRKMCRILFGHCLDGDGTIPRTARRHVGRSRRKRERKTL